MKTRTVWNETRHGFVAYVRHNAAWLTYLAAVAIVAFGYEIFHFNISFDEERRIYSNDTDVGWLEQGRWGVFVLGRILWPNPIVPFLNTLCSVLLIAASYAVFVEALPGRRHFGHTLAAPLFIACPTLYYALTFATLSHAIGFGFLFSSLAVYVFFGRSDLRANILFALLATFSIALYQVYVVFLVLAFLVCALHPERKGNIPLSELVRFLLLLLLAVAAYFIVNQLFLGAFGTVDSGYTRGFVRLEATKEYVLATLTGGWRTWKALYLGDPSVYLIPLPLGIFAAVCLVARHLRPGRPWTAQARQVLLSLALLTVPLSFDVVSRGFMPVRTYLALPLALSSLCFLAYPCLSGFARDAFVVFVAFLSLQFCVADSRLAYAEAVSWERDRQTILRVQVRLDEVKPDVSDGKIRLAVLGSPPYPASALHFENNTIGGSFLQKQRFVDILRHLGNDEYTLVDLRPAMRLWRFAAKMPFWPAKGSVACIRRACIVRFSEKRARWGRFEGRRQVEDTERRATASLRSISSVE